MTGFAADWLDLREPFDGGARSAVLVREYAAGLQAGRTLHAVDLATGTGANIRYLAPRLGVDQAWRAIDDDAALLGLLPDRMHDWGSAAGARIGREDAAIEVRTRAWSVHVRTERRNLAAGLPDLGETDLVTASALADLVSPAWLDRLIAACRDAQAAILLALTYDGAIDWTPALDGDAPLRDAVNAHQRIDKGFGPALGPAAADHALAALRANGYVVREARSDWAFGCEARAMQAALLDDWCRAAAAVMPQAVTAIDDWQRRREACLASGQSRLRVGHRDILALPSGSKAP